MGLIISKDIKRDVLVERLRGVDEGYVANTNVTLGRMLAQQVDKVVQQDMLQLSHKERLNKAYAFFKCVTDRKTTSNVDFNIVQVKTRYNFNIVQVKNIKLSSCH